MAEADGGTFRVALTADFVGADGRPQYPDIGLSVFDGQPHVSHFMLADHRPQIEPEQIEAAQAVMVLTPSVTRHSVSQADQLLAIGRFGVGYDSVDVQACTESDVLVFIAAGAVDRSVAEATVGWMLALTHHMRAKDQLVRSGEWNRRSSYMGSELRDRVLGVVGLGGIARMTIQLLSGWGMQMPLAFDPFVSAEQAEALGVRLVGLDELLREADFVSIHCPRNDSTNGLIGARELALMKPDAYLINTARGGIVDEVALGHALEERRIAGAAIDCFDKEPLTEPHPLGQLDNVLFAPHSIAWTNELFRDIGLTVCRGLVDLSLGRRPPGIVNPGVLQQASFAAKWNRICSRPGLRGPHSTPSHRAARLPRQELSQ